MASQVSPTRSQVAGRSLATAAVIGAGLLAYSLIEANSYRLRSVVAPVLPAGQDPLLVLHLSDMHMTPQNRSRREWISGLVDLSPDLVVATGDFLSHPDAIGSVVTALGPLLDLPGAFVLGSNDYFGPSIGNPFSYFSGPSTDRRRGPDLPWEDLVATLVGCGWANLNNRRETINVGKRIVDARGTDDPHIGLDRYDEVAGPFDASADLALAVTHAPYLRVIDAMSDDHADLILAGHTHGGQVCVPGYGALVTNCDLDRKRVKGLHRNGDSWMHVSAGLGTNPYTPIRFACPPEATLLTLIAKSNDLGL